MVTSVQNGFVAVDPLTAADKLGEGECATATNVDFGASTGAASVRRGSADVGTLSASKIIGIYRLYNNPTSIGSCPFYVADGAGVVQRGVVGGPFTPILTGGATEYLGFTAYRDHAYISSLDKHVKDDGSTTTDWIKQHPEGPVQVVVNTLAPKACLWGTWAFTKGTGSQSSGTCTATASDNVIAVTLDYGGPTDINVNGTNTIGNFGIQCIDLAFGDPSKIVSVQQQFSIGDAAFTNYLYASVAPASTDGSIPDVATLIDSQIAVGTSSLTLTAAQRDEMIAQVREMLSQPVPALPTVPNAFATWAEARPNWGLAGTFTGTASPWASIRALRVVVTFDSAVDETCVIANPKVIGAEKFCLTDSDVGFMYWNTFATLDTNGNVLGESTPSGPSSRYLAQQANFTVQMGTAPTGNHGLTHWITYRQGGYLEDAYAIATTPLGTTSFVDSLTDIQALSVGKILERNLHANYDLTANVVCASEPFRDRIFIGYLNKLAWSLPGRPEAFPLTSEATVGASGDEVHAVIVWPPGLIVVNAESVYELHGSIFEGSNQDWILQRTGSARGSRAPRTAIKTPYGIPLIDYDGISMYVPGQGVDTPLEWAMAKLADVFRGTGTTDPAGAKGNRVPALNRAQILKCTATYAEGRLYLAMPCGVGTECNTVFVLDFPTKRVWWYVYPFNISSLFWDYQDNRLFAGSPNGHIYQLEVGVLDGASPISWNVRTRTWTSNSEAVLENVSVEYEGAAALLTVTFDQTTSLCGTLTSTNRVWQTPPLNGSFANNVRFDIAGTATGLQTVYGLKWDCLAEPPRVYYHRADYDLQQNAGESLWDTATYDLQILGTGVVKAVTFVDGTAVMTNSLTGPTSGRKVHNCSFPAESYGQIAYTTYTSSVQFKPWRTTYASRPEPNRVNYWKSDVQSMEENICDGWDVDINPAGTAYGTCWVDNIAVATDTYIGTARQSFASTIPVETYGRTIYVTYSGNGFKHYNTWYHLRQEPDRVSTFVSPRQDMAETELRLLNCVINPLGTALCTAVVDGTAVATYTATGSGHQAYSWALPSATYGKSAYAIYSGGLKHYHTEFKGDAEPERVTNWRVGPLPFSSTHNLKTWLVQLDPLGGVVTGTVLVDNIAIFTSTFTGPKKQSFSVGIDLLPTFYPASGKVVEILYTSPTKFKHYDTQFETEPKPFGKTSWVINYKKLGGASQLDMARFLDLDVEVVGSNIPLTYYLDVDGVTVAIGNVAVTSRHYFDRIPLPPGCRGYLFQLRIVCTAGCQVWRSSIDVEQVGIKGFVRRTKVGTPQ